jgi:cis-3-alkyl-4-acyloxetan-2-one decarboxylase
MRFDSPSDPPYRLVSSIGAGLEHFLQTPAMICWGERDVVFPAATLDLWRQHWPHAEIHRFSDCGHWVLEDAPAEIGEKVAAFMAK